MINRFNKQRLLSSAVLTIGGAIAALSFAGSAQAQSVCTANTVPSPDTYACTNGGGNGTITDGATVTPTAQGLQVGNTAATTVTQAGTITTNNGQSAVYQQITGAGATYTSTGTTASTAPSTFTTYVRGSTANATTNIINATGDGSRALVTISDAGANTTTAGTTTVIGDNAYGIQATSTGGALTLNSGTTSLTSSTALGGGFGVLSISTGGANTTTGTSTTVNANNAVGISASATGGNLIVNSGTVSATGIGDVGVQTASTTGNNTTTATSTTVNGVNAYGIQASSNVGNLVVNGGTVSATGAGSYGIAATSVGGTNTVNGGTTTATGVNATGISATGNDGALVVNTGNVAATGTGAVGVRTSTIAGAGTCGTSTINVTGNVSGVASGVNADACGAGTVNVNSGRTVTASAGTAIINNATGVATTNVSGTVTAAAGQAAIDNNGTSSVTTLNSGAVVTGTFNGTVGADSFTIANGATFNTAGTSDFGLGVDTLTNAGTLNTTGATTFLGLENFASSGTVNLAPALFSVPTSTSFSNSGTINATGGSTTITSLAPVANSGTINLQDGATGDFLTINNNYVGSGLAALNIDSSLVASDLLIVNGNSSGSTRVNANMLGAGLINIPGNLVVDNLTSTPSAFVLGTVSGNTSPLVNYALVQNGADYYLTASPTAAAFDPMAVSNLASSIWYQSADEVQNQTDLPAVTVGASLWGQAYYSHDRFGDKNDTVVLQGTTYTVDNRVKTRRMGIQGGVDYGFGGARVGLTGGYGEAKSSNDLSSRFKATGWNAGLYGQFGGPIGFHGSALVKHDSYKLRFTDGAFLGERARLRADGVDGSLGYRFGMGGDSILDAKIGLSHVRTKVDNISAFGFTYDYGRMTSTRGRAGLRATFAGELAPYIDASIHHEFDGNRNLRLFDGANSYNFDSPGKGTWGRIEAGLTGRDGPGPILALWADVGDKRGFGARAGFRFGGRAAEMVAPPAPMAPPPPPPPPATQICADGSVILATDMCPPPPPPPPPPPAAPLPSGERG